MAKARHHIRANKLWAAFLLFVAACGSFTPSYFPPSAFSDLQDYEAELPRRFSRYLAAAEEPVLFDDDAIDFAVRLTIMPSFTPAEVVTLSRDKEGVVTVRKVQLSLSLEPEDARIVSRATFAALPRNVDLLLAAVDRHKFWAATNEQRFIGSDGSLWVLEVKSSGRYHAAYQWEDSESAVYQIGDVLLDIAGSG